MSDNNDQDNIPRYILFDRDWSPSTTLAVQAKRLVDNRRACGVGIHVLLTEQQLLMSLENYMSIRWMFYNAMVMEIESRL